MFYKLTNYIVVLLNCLTYNSEYKYYNKNNNSIYKKLQLLYKMHYDQNFLYITI